MNRHPNAPLELPELFSIDAEQSILGGLLLSPTAFDRIGDVLQAADFYREDHRAIYRFIVGLIEKNRPVDVISVAEVIDAAGESETTGGLAYLGQLAHNTPSAANIRHYAEIVVGKRLLRELAAASADIAAIAQRPGTDDPLERVEKAQARIMAISESRPSGNEPKAIGTVLSSVIEKIEERYHRDGALSGLATGFPDLDDKTCGLQPGDLIIIAGRPSMGKTTVAVNIAEHTALEGGVALVYSLEMGAEQLGERTIASVGGISTNSLRTGKLSDDEWSRLSFALGKLHETNLVIDDTAGISPLQMSVKARRVKRQHGRLDLIVVDYLQLMSDDGDNRTQELGNITRKLKLMARELQVPVIALSQLSRKVEERTDKRPILSDLRESGAIEQDADVVMMMYRDDYYKPDSPFKGMAEALIRKQRMGACGTVPLVFQGEFSRFKSADAGAYAEAVGASQNQKSNSRKGMDL